MPEAANDNEPIGKTREKLFSKDRYKALHDEWHAYQGTVWNPDTENHERIEDIMGRDVQTLASKIKAILESKVEGDEKNLKKIEQELLKLAKKAFLASHGHVGPDAEKGFNKEDLEQRAQEYLTSIANAATEGRVNNYHEALHQILSAKKPFNPVKEGDASPILQALYTQLARDLHRLPDGRSHRRLEYITRELSNPNFNRFWREQYREVLMKLGGYDAGFKPSASGPEIMDTYRRLVLGEELNLKAPHIDVKGHKRYEKDREKPPQHPPIKLHNYSGRPITNNYGLRGNLPLIEVGASGGIKYGKPKGGQKTPDKMAA